MRKDPGAGECSGSGNGIAPNSTHKDCTLIKLISFFLIGMDPCRSVQWVPKGGQQPGPSAEEIRELVEQVRKLIAILERGSP